MRGYGPWLWSLAGLAQNEELGCAGRETGGRGGVGAITWTGACRSYFSFPCWQLFVVA
jgi:hypothetical protein